MTGEIGGRGRRSVAFQLTSAAVGCSVDVRLDDCGGRWLAVANHDGRREVGLGASPRKALASALGSLGREAAAALMADPGLFAVSCAVHEMTATS